VANNYIQFAGEFHIRSLEEHTWFRHALRDVEAEVFDVDGNVVEAKVKALLDAEPWRDAECDDEYGPDFQFTFDVAVPNPADGFGRLFVYAEECGSAWAAGQLAHAFLKKFRPTEFWSVEWAETCDKMRTDNFGGGAVVATAKEVRISNSTNWVARMARHFTRTGELPPVRKVKRYKTGRFKGMTGTQILAKMGWDDAMWRMHLSGFLAERGLSNAFVEYLAHCAVEEEEEEKNDAL
jgi:hypothetical protein